MLETTERLAGSPNAAVVTPATAVLASVIALSLLLPRKKLLMYVIVSPQMDAKEHFKVVVAEHPAKEPFEDVLHLGWLEQK